MCAFVWPFKKTTNLWIDLGFDWQPKGTTGDGRCGGKCGQGREDPITKRFRHFMALAVDPQRGPRGTNAGHVVNDPMTQRDLADPMTQLDFNDPTRPNDPVDPVDPSQV